MGVECAGFRKEGRRRGDQINECVCSDESEIRRVLSAQCSTLRSTHRRQETILFVYLYYSQVTSFGNLFLIFNTTFVCNVFFCNLSKLECAQIGIVKCEQLEV